MEGFIVEPTLAERMGRRSRQIAEEKYDVHKVNAVMLREMGVDGNGERSKVKCESKGQNLLKFNLSLDAG